MADEDRKDNRGNGRTRSRPAAARRSATATRAPATTAARAPAAPPATRERAATPSRAPVGGISLDESLSGLATQTLEADVTDELGRVAPTFGNVLSSIGIGVADSQTALDNGLVETVKELANTKIKVVTDVIQKLDDDGLVKADETELVTQDLSVLNFFMPTVHEWRTVKVSMDLNVGEIDNTTGMTFKRSQYSIGASTYGAFWGLLGVGEHHDTESEQSGRRSTRDEVDWSTGQVRLDAVLGARRSGSFRPPARVETGPQIYLSQGAITEATNAGVRTRSVKVRVKVLKADGSVAPGKVLEVDGGGLTPSFDPGSTTDADGIVNVTLSRVIPLGIPVGNGRWRVTIHLNDIRKTSIIVL